MSTNTPDTAERRGVLSGRSAASEMRQRKLAAGVDLAVAIRP